MPLTKHQIEHAKTLTFEDIEEYAELTQQDIEIQQLPHSYFIPNEFDDNDTRYMFVDGRFYRLPKTDTREELPYTLMTQLVYEAKRHGWDDEPCKTLRKMLKRLQGELYEDNIVKVQSLLELQETSAGTYFGQYLSDDSDSEAEAAFQDLSVEKRQKKQARSKAYRKKLGDGKYKTRTKKILEDNPTATPIKQCNDNHLQIPRTAQFNRREVQAELDKINKRLADGEVVDEAFLETLQNRYVVAQYRGIHYFTTNWDMVARRMHREMDEVGKAQFSSAAFHGADVASYHQFLEKLQSEPDLIADLIAQGETIQESLIRMMNSPPVTFKGRAYVSLFHLLQHWYSYDYDGFPGKVQAELDKPNNLFSDYLQSAQRPFLSTGDTPRHPLFYAYGVKVYEEHKDERLRPRWRRDGRPERPYSGKIYVSLHPLTDFTTRHPSHITSMFIHGTIPLDNLIAAERETSFLGYMPEDRVVKTHKAKYLSFKGDYKAIYESKYGIDRGLYLNLKAAFAKYPPHSTRRKQLKHLLGEYLCAYQEVRLIDKANRKAQSRGEVLLYRDEKGGFALKPPGTPTTRSNRLRDIIMVRRDLYNALAAGTMPHVATLSRADFENRSAAWSDATKVEMRYCLFEHKQPPLEVHPEQHPILAMAATIA